MCEKPPSSPSPSPSPSSPSPSSSQSSFVESFEREAAEYLKELRRRGQAESTIDKVSRELVKLKLFLLIVKHPPRTVSDISVEMVSAFRDHEMTRERQWRGEGRLAGATVRRIVALLRGFFRHLVRRGVLLLDPALDLAGPRRLKRLPKDVPTARQMKSLLASPDEGSALGKRDRAVVELFYSSGLRNAELCSLRLSDVDLVARTAFVRKGKGGHERMVPIGKKAALALSGYLAIYEVLSSRSKRIQEPAAQRPLFLNRVGKGLNPECARQLLSRLVTKARLTVKATPHTLRHACATHLLRGGAGIRQIQVLLGHQTLDSTQLYTRVVTTDLRRMLDKHHPRGKPEPRPRP